MKPWSRVVFIVRKLSFLKREIRWPLCSDGETKDFIFAGSEDRFFCDEPNLYKVMTTQSVEASFLMTKEAFFAPSPQKTTDISGRMRANSAKRKWNSGSAFLQFSARKIAGMIP